MTTKDKIKLQEWWIGELKTITQKVITQEEKRQAKKSKELAEYASRDDILDAYGMDMISERKKDSLLDAWDNMATSGIYAEKIALLAEFMNDAKRILQEVTRA